MDLGLHIANFTWSGGSSTFVDDFRRTAKTAEDVGFTRLSVMDHVWQIGMIGPPEHEMLEAYTALGYLAAVTDRVQLLAWVTAAVYRRGKLRLRRVCARGPRPAPRAGRAGRSARGRSGARCPGRVDPARLDVGDPGGMDVRPLPERFLAQLSLLPEGADGLPEA